MAERKDWGRWANWRSSFLSNTPDEELVTCGCCGRPVIDHFFHTRGGRPENPPRDYRCDACWEVEHRLAAYLQDGGGKAVAFVTEALAECNYVKARS